MKLNDRSKKLGAAMLVVIFIVFPFKWGSTQASNIKAENQSAKDKTAQIETLLSSVASMKAKGDLSVQQNGALQAVPQDASLPTIIPMLANVGVSSGMTLIAGTPSKNANSGSSLSTLSLPVSSSTFSLSLSFEGNLSNVNRLLDNLESMTRVLRIESFSVQSGNSKGTVTVNINAKFYSVAG